MNSFFSYANGLVKSKDGQCLARTENRFYFDTIREANACIARNGDKKDLTLSESWEVDLDVDVEMQACDTDNPNQRWEPRLVGGVSFQLVTPSNQCLSLSADPNHGSIFIRIPGTLFDCGGIGYANSVTRPYHADNHRLLVGACTERESNLEFGVDNLIVIDKIVPIVIPM